MLTLCTPISCSIKYKRRKRNRTPIKLAVKTTAATRTRNDFSQEMTMVYSQMCGHKQQQKQYKLINHQILLRQIS